MLKTDCLYFCADRPCSYHKEKGAICASCAFYKPFGFKILIIKLGAAGDVLRTTCILNPLSEKYSKENTEPAIYWVTEEKCLPVLENIPQIKEVLPYNPTSLVRLMIEQFDLMINLDLAPEALALSALVKVLEKRGFGLDGRGLPIYLNEEAKAWFEMSHNDRLKKANKKTYQEYALAIAGVKPGEGDSGIILNLNENERTFAAGFAKRHLLKKYGIVAGLNTGAGGTWEKKEWPAELTFELIREIGEKGINGKKAAILLFGGERESKRNKYILKKAGKRAIDTGADNSVRNFFALMDLCDVIVTTDTLALHASLALGKRTVALFGPTSPDEIEMYGLGEKITAPVECAVCYKRICKYRPDCMSSISAETVFKSVKKNVNFLKFS